MRCTRTLFLAVLCVGLGAADATAQRRDQAPPFTPGWAGPQLEAQPDRGPPGTRVVITGARFRDGARAFYGDRPMQILGRDDRTLVAVIPPGARGNRFIFVVDPSGRARTRTPFQIGRVRDPRFDPRFEDPRFDRRRFEDPRLDRRRFEEPWFEEPWFEEPWFEEPWFEEPWFEDPRFEEPWFEEPWFEEPRFDDPRFDDPRGRLGPGRARPDLEVAPLWGEPGTPVVLSGRRFGAEATPYYGDQRMRVLRRGDGYLLAEIPRGATSERFIYVVDRRGLSRSADPFELAGPLDW